MHEIMRQFHATIEKAAAFQEVSQSTEELQGIYHLEYHIYIKLHDQIFRNIIKHVGKKCRHHHNGRWEARIGRVFGNKYLYLGTYSKSSAPPNPNHHLNVDFKFERLIYRYTRRGSSCL